MKDKSFQKGFAAGFLVLVLIIAAFWGVHVLRGFKGQETLSVGEKAETIKEILNQLYVETVDDERLNEGLYKGMVASLGDPYTSYMTKGELSNFLEETDGSFWGIGVRVVKNENDALEVVTVITGTPAEKAGLAAKDVILKVNDQDITDMDMDSIVKMIKGPEGTEVKITVYRPKTGQTLDFTLTRSQIQVETVSCKMLEEEIGYIRITQFNKNTYEQFLQAYENLNSQNMKGLVIDLRNNPGGIFDVATKITDMLLPEGTIVYTIDKTGNRIDTFSDKECIEIPYCVLVNGGSASASEILSGAVQDYGIGKLVGTQTFGKGLVQGLYPLPDGSGLKITIQKYYTPNGICIQGEGISPDYKVSLPPEVVTWSDLTQENDTQLQKAIEVIEAQWEE